MFSCEFCKIFNNSFFIEYLRWYVCAKEILNPINLPKDCVANILTYIVNVKHLCRSTWKIRKKVIRVLKDNSTLNKEFKVTTENIIILDECHAKGNVIGFDLPPTTTLTFRQGNNSLLTLADSFVCQTWTKNKFKCFWPFCGIGT